MATRFYLPSSGTAPASPALDPNGVWEHESALARLPMRPIRTGTAFANSNYSGDAADHLVDQDALNRQFVGPEMLPQTIASQTVKLQMLCSEVHTNNNLFLTFEIFVCSRDGSTIKETLVAITRDTVNEMVLTTNTNRSHSATSSAATVEDGDRLVLNIGYGGLPGPAAGGVQGHNGTLRLGDSDTVDLPENDSQTADDNPWLEFVDDEILFPQPWVSEFPEIVFRRKPVQQNVAPFTPADIAPPVPDFVPLFLPQRVGQPALRLQGLFAFLPDVAPPAPDFVQMFVSLPRAIQGRIMSEGMAFVPFIAPAAPAGPETIPAAFGPIIQQTPSPMVGY